MDAVARATMAAALIINRAVELPSIPSSGAWALNAATVRLRDLTDDVYQIITKSKRTRTDGSRSEVRHRQRSECVSAGADPQRQPSLGVGRDRSDNAPPTYQRGSVRRRDSPPNPPAYAGFGRASLTVRLRPPS